MTKQDTADNIAVGAIIRQKLKQRKMSVSAFAKAINCSRTNVYNIFERKTLDITRLKQIATVLEFDISDFIIITEDKVERCIAVIEIEEKELEQLRKEYDLIYIKTWRT